MYPEDSKNLKKLCIRDKNYIVYQMNVLLEEEVLELWFPQLASSSALSIQDSVFQQFTPDFHLKDFFPDFSELIF